MKKSSFSLKSVNPIKQIDNIKSYTDPSIIFSRGIDYLRNIEFSKQWLWNIRVFPDPWAVITLPPQFIINFPAADFSFDEAKLGIFARDFYINNYRVPASAAERTFSLTFYDNNANDIFNWFKDWINIDILNNGNFISCLGDDHARTGSAFNNGLPVVGNVRPARKFVIEKLDNSQKVITTEIITVFPLEGITFKGTSESGVNVYSMDFVIIDDGAQTVINKLLGALASNVLNQMPDIAGKVGGKLANKISASLKKIKPF